MTRQPAGTLEAPPHTDRSERRYVYNGDRSKGDELNNPQRGNRPVKKHRRSSFNIIAALFVVSILTVFYVWNKITVNRLVIEVNDLQSQYQKIVSANEVIRAEINRKSSLERIGKLAGPMGLGYPKEQPVWFDVDNEKIVRYESSGN